jgi:4-amino-4-deoxy-L-arabinose transferase-like glycosyltransferase
MDKKIFSVLLISLLARIFYFFHSHPIWWDAAVYLSMGKYIFSVGQLGLWEPIRPLLWPTLLGYGWFIGLNPEIWGYILTTFFSLGIIYLTYLIAKKYFNQKVALYSAIIISFTWIFFFFNYRLYTEIPSVFFALLALYSYQKNDFFLTGVAAGLAFLTKFPQGIILVVFSIIIFKSLKKFSKLILGFILIIFPYLAFNYFLYGSPIENLLFASEVLKFAGIWIFQQPWHYYFTTLLYQNILFLLAIPGIYFAFKKKKYVLILLFILFLIYFIQMAHKEVRFTIMFLPYLAILASLAYDKLIKRLPEILIIITLVFFAINFQMDYYPINEEFHQFPYSEGEIIITNPLTAYYTPSATTLLYYAWFDYESANTWLQYIQKNKPEYVSIDSCEGGFLCHPDEPLCEEAKEEIINYLEENYYKEYYKKIGICEYSIYSYSKSLQSLQS